MAEITRSDSLRRSARSVVTLGPFTVPVDATGEYQVVADIDPIDYETPGKVMVATVLREARPGIWRSVAGAVWQGGRYTDESGAVNPPPVLAALNSEKLRGAVLKVELRCETTITTGARVTQESR